MVKIKKKSRKSGAAVLHRKEEKLHHIAERAMKADEKLHKKLEKAHHSEEKHSSRKMKAAGKKAGKKLKKMVKRAKKSSKIEKVMHEYKHGELHSGSKKGPRVKSRRQAIAIALSEARKAGAKIRRKRKKA